MPDNQIAIPVPQECWNILSRGSLLPRAYMSLLLAVERDGDPETVDGFHNGANWAERGKDGINGIVVAWMPKPKFDPPPPPVEVGQVRVSPTGVKCCVAKTHAIAGCMIEIDLGDVKPFAWLSAEAVATWPIAEGTA